MRSSECSGRRRGYCGVLGCAWSALRGPFTEVYIVCSYMLAFTVHFRSSFPCILLQCEGSSGKRSSLSIIEDWPFVYLRRQLLTRMLKADDLFVRHSMLHTVHFVHQRRGSSHVPNDYLVACDVCSTDLLL